MAVLNCSSATRYGGLPARNNREYTPAGRSAPAILLCPAPILITFTDLPNYPRTKCTIHPMEELVTGK